MRDYRNANDLTDKTAVMTGLRARDVAAGRGSILKLGSMSEMIGNRPQHAASYMASKGAIGKN